MKRIISLMKRPIRFWWQRVLALISLIAAILLLGLNWTRHSSQLNFITPHAVLSLEPEYLEAKGEAEACHPTGLEYYGKDAEEESKLLQGRSPSLYFPGLACGSDTHGMPASHFLEIWSGYCHRSNDCSSATEQVTLSFIDSILSKYSLYRNSPSSDSIRRDLNGQFVRGVNVGLFKDIYMKRFNTFETGQFFRAIYWFLLQPILLYLLVRYVLLATINYVVFGDREEETEKASEMTERP